MAEMEADIPYTVKDPLWVDGIPYPNDFKEGVIRKLSDTTVYDDDIYIAGYLKSGHHWLVATVEGILRSDELDAFVSSGSRYEFLPIEHPGGYPAHISCTRPRVANTMMRYSSLPRGIAKGLGKVIHISRNPRDVAVSYFHFTKMYTEGYGTYTGTWDDFFKSFMAGHVSRGKWYDYMIDWMKYRETPNMLFIKYEEYYHSPKEMIKQIAMFLGRELNEETVDRIAAITSFKSMKSNANLTFKHELVKGDFMRKGVVGDWKNYFSPEQVKEMDEMYQKFKSETGEEFTFE